MIIIDCFSNNAVHSSQLFTVDLLDQSLCAAFRGWLHNNNFFYLVFLITLPIRSGVWNKTYFHLLHLLYNKFTSTKN